MGFRIKVISMVLTVEKNTTIQFRSATTILTGPMTLKSGGGMVLPDKLRGWFTTGVNESFNIVLTASAQISGTLQYVQVA